MFNIEFNPVVNILQTIVAKKKLSIKQDSKNEIPR